MRKLIAAGVALVLMSIFANNANATPLATAGSSLKQAASQSSVTKAWYHTRHYGWYRGRHYGWYRHP